MKVKTRTLYKLVGSDYSAQEPRITTFLGGDPAMRAAYLEGKDLYCVIAANIYNNKYEVSDTGIVRRKDN
jgi:DNA polymerase I-like protein with 3'-5' exonuclease and polymerase domains